MSYETIGIWPEGADGTDINVASRSQDKTLLATGDDFGKVKLYTYPASKPKVILKLETVTILVLINLPTFLVALLFVRWTLESRHIR